MNLQQPIVYNSNSFVKKQERVAVYKTPFLQLLQKNKFYHLSCANENIITKKELIPFLQFARSVFKVQSYTKLLITPGEGANLDIGSWTVLSKIKFEKTTPLKIAFVSNSLYQNLLFNRLQLLNNNVRVFDDKKSAMKWLQNKIISKKQV